MTANRLGIDFSQDYFDLLLAGESGQPVTPTRRFVHDRLGCQAALDYVIGECQKHPSDELWIGGEATGMLWWHLFQQWEQSCALAQLHPLFYLLNPAPVKGFRKAAPPADKTDKKDARLIARYLGVPDQNLVAWMPDPSNDPLRFLTRYHYRLAHQLGTLKVQALTWLYLKDSAYGLLEPFKDPFSKTSRSILRQYPDLDSLLAVPLEALAEQLQTLARGGLHDPLENACRLQAVAQHSYPISDELRDHLHLILSCQLDLIAAFEKQIKAVDRAITQVVAEDADIANLRSLGGLGPVFSAGLAAELRPTQRFFQNQRYNPDTGAWHSPTWAQAQAAVGKLAGLWWPASDSGKFVSEERHMPRACNPYLRYYLIEAADHARERVAEFGAFYQRKKAEAVKHAHHRALVLTARKLARVVFALLHKHQTYQPRKVA